LRQDDPVMFLEHKHLYMTKGPVPEGEHIVEFGKADIKRPGRDVTIIAWSNMVPRALEAAAALAEEGIEAEVVDPRACAARHRDDPRFRRPDQSRRHRTGGGAPRGVASDIASIIQEEAFYELDAPIEIVAGLNIPIPFNLELEKASVPQKDDVIRAARRALHIQPTAIAAK
jgi:pyruvate/2-oxoglutarate/acetoin dehydrogenase E1 component